MSIKATQLEDGTLAETKLDTAALAKLNAGTNPVQVSAGERTAGTEVALRSFSPDDIAAMAVTHGSDGGETNTASSAGGTESLVLAKSGSNLPFKGLTAGANITLTPSGTDIVIAASGGGGTPGVTAHTVDATLAAGVSGDLQTNRGATGIVVLTLPVTGGLAVGTNFPFRRLASFALRVDPQAADNLRYSGGAMSAGEYLEMASDEAMLRVLWDGAEWLVDDENGTITEETP